jgi:nucleotide-binding universal stress UspA family protein
MNKILVPVDFSEYSKPALGRAAAFARPLAAEVHLLHVSEPPFFVPPPHEQSLNSPFDRATIAGMIEAQNREAIGELVGEASAHGIVVSRASVVAGHPSRTIVDVARRERYDLVVLGTHGRTGFSRAILGSVSERVVRYAPCPVLTVRGGAPARQALPTRILVPVDYSESSMAALSYATFLARSFHASLEVVHVWERPGYVRNDVLVQEPDAERRTLVELIHRAAERQMTDFLEAFRVAQGGSEVDLPKHRLLSGEPVSSLLAELERGQHDLVVVGTLGRTGFAHLLLGSVAERVVRLSPIPVVTVPSAHRANVAHGELAS